MENLELVEFLPGREYRKSSSTYDQVNVEQVYCSSSGDEDEQDRFIPATNSLASAPGKGMAPLKHGIALKRDMTLLSCVALITGTMIGSGIYVAPQDILAHAGSFGMCVILWVVLAMVAVGGGLCYVELGLLLKKSGGEFAYVFEAYSFNHRNRGVTLLGALLGFLCIWVNFSVSGTTSLAISVLLCARYFIQPFFGGCCGSELAVKYFAIAILILICIINFLSVKMASRIITLFSVLKILSLLFIVAVGVVFTLQREKDIPNTFHHPFTTTEGFVTTPSSLSLAAYGVFWSYSGWNSVNYTIEETKDLARNLPLSLLIGIPIVAVCYLLVNMAFFTVLSYDEIIRAEAIALSFGVATLGSAGLIIIPVMVGISVFGSCTSSLLASSRTTFVAARDGFLPEVLCGLHVTQRTPLPAIIVQGVISGMMAWMGDISSLIDGFIATSLLINLLCFVGLIIMRFTHREKPRLFKAWFILPVAGFMVVVFLFLVFMPLLLQPVPSLVAFCVVLLGVPVYLFFVMEKPWKLRPKILDTVSGIINDRISLLLNTETAKHKTQTF